MSEKTTSTMFYPGQKIIVKGGTVKINMIGEVFKVEGDNVHFWTDRDHEPRCANIAHVTPINDHVVLSDIYYPTPYTISKR